MANRDQAIVDFQEQAGVNVLIVSLKAAALGLNLVAANHVVLMDLVRTLHVGLPETYARQVTLHLLPPTSKHLLLVLVFWLKNTSKQQSTNGKLSLHTNR